jgi:enoyl-CoA hydratase
VATDAAPWRKLNAAGRTGVQRGQHFQARLLRTWRHAKPAPRSSLRIDAATVSRILSRCISMAAADHRSDVLARREKSVATVLHDSVRVEHRGPVTVATIAHPPANAINAAVIAGIREALEAAAASDDCRVLVITGDGDRFFAAGADITEFATSGGEGIVGSQSLTPEIEGCRIPVIAAVNGIAFGGGCEIALSCDLRVASSTARFGQPEIKLGIIPGWGGTQRLPRLIGRTAAMELLLTGDPIDAEQALALGLVNAVVQPDELQDKVFELGNRIASQAPLAVAAIKRAVYTGIDVPINEALDAERGEFTRVFDTEDAREGVSAFLEKRRPTWQGR